MNQDPTYTSIQRKALSTYVKLMRASVSVSEDVSKSWREAGLTGSQFGVLEALYHLGPICQKEIAQKILKTTGNITMVIENLNKRDLVYRIRDKNDRRYIRIHLTSKGKSLIEKIFPRHVDDITNRLAILSTEEQNQFASICKKLGLGNSD